MKRKFTVRRFIAIIIAICLCVSLIPGIFAAPDNVSGDDPTGDINSLTPEQRNSINMLNYLTVLVQEINASSNSRLFLESAYSELLNNTEPSIVDEDTKNQYDIILKTINAYRMINVKRERLEYIYDQNNAVAFRNSIPTPLAILNIVESKNLLKSFVSVAYLAIDSVSSYQSYASELELKFLQDTWELDDALADKLANISECMFDYMVKKARDLPRGITLNMKNVNEFVQWKNDPNLSSRIRWLESNEKTYQYYGEYWLVRADSYYSKALTDGDIYYQNCLNSIAKYESLDNSIFRYDYRFARSLPYAIVAARELYDDTIFVGLADKYANLILSNTDKLTGSDWSLRYFAAQTFLHLYTITNNSEYLRKAYDIAYDNVNVLLSQQLKLNDTYLASLQLESKDGKSKKGKTEVEKYNDLLKATREIELPPVLESFRLNCDLLFALVNKLDNSADEKSEIQNILHPAGNPVFLNPILDNMYSFSSNSYDCTADSIPVTYTKNSITLPAMFMTDSATITVSIKDEDSIISLEDWKIDKVTRNKSDNVEDFTVTYTSAKAKKIKYSDASVITVTIIPISDATYQAAPMVFTFNTIQNKIVGVSLPISFERFY